MHTESILFIDPQRRPERRCCLCGSCIYPPGYRCVRCERSQP